MSDDWATTTIGEIAEVVGGGTPRTTVPEYWGGAIPWITPSEVTAQEGKVITSTERTITEEGLAKSNAHLLPEGAVLLTSRATIGAVALAGVPMATNQGFASLVAGPHVLPEFLVFWCQVNKPKLLALAVGNTFKEISKTNVRTLSIDLPPLAEQRRIVDLVESLDVCAEEAATCQAASRLLLSAYRQAFLDSSTPGIALGEVSAMRSGPSWKRDQESTSPTPGTIPVIGITNTLPDGRLVLDERTYVVGLPSSVMRLDNSSLILIRTNGNRTRIGNAYRSTAEMVGHAASAFQIAMTPNAPDDRDFIFHVIEAPSTQAAITLAASGSTGLGNIAISWLKACRLPWPSSVERVRFAQVCNELEEVADAYRAFEENTRSARTAFLASLLSGSVTLPDSYDRFVEAV